MPAKAYTTTEHLMTAYLQADLKAQLGAAELTGNVGVQAVGTEQKSRGLVYNGTGYTNIAQGAITGTSCPAPTCRCACPATGCSASPPRAR